MSSRSPARVPYIEAALATQRSESLFSTIAKHRSAFFFFASVFPSIFDLCARCDRGSEARALARVCDGRDCVRRACDTRTTRTDVHLDSRVLLARPRSLVCVFTAQTHARRVSHGRGADGGCMAGIRLCACACACGMTELRSMYAHCRDATLGVHDEWTPTRHRTAARRSVVSWR